MCTQSRELGLQHLRLLLIQPAFVFGREMVQQQVVMGGIEALCTHRQVEAQRPLVGGLQLRLQLEQRDQWLRVQLDGHSLRLLKSLFSDP